MQRVLENQETQVMQELKLMEQRMEQVEMATRQTPLLPAAGQTTPSQLWTGRAGPAQMMFAAQPTSGQPWFGQLAPSQGQQWQGGQQPVPAMPMPLLLQQSAPAPGGWWGQGGAGGLQAQQGMEEPPGQVQFPSSSGPDQPWLDQMSLR